MFIVMCYWLTIIIINNQDNFLIFLKHNYHRFCKVIKLTNFKNFQKLAKLNINFKNFEEFFKLFEWFLTINTSVQNVLKYRLNFL